MAQVYFDKDSAPKTLGEADIRETSKVEEMPRSSSVSKHDQEAKNCEESSPKESNVIRVTANAASSEREDDVQDSVMDSEDDKNSANSSQHGNEHKSNDCENSQPDSTNNMLRRSERNAKNHQNALGGYGRRPFKYDDDFEYGPNIGAKKTAPEMDPPGSTSSNKRRRKASQMAATPFAEGSLKRSASAKTPSSHATLTSNDNNGVTYNQGRWTCYEHFKFLEALKRYGKEWQKVQQHVSTRTSTQARSHAQKFFVKLDKKSLTLEEFLKDLDLKEVEKTLLASGMDNTDYDEEREVNMVANRKLRGSVMNIALPSNSEDKKQEVSRGEGGKRKRSEIESYNRGEGSREQSINNIRRAFEQHANEGNTSNSQRTLKRVKTSERGERGYTHHPDKEEKPCSEMTAATGVSKAKETEDRDTPLRKLSVSNFEPIQPSPMIKAKSSFTKDTLPLYGTPQPNRTESMIINKIALK